MANNHSKLRKIAQEALALWHERFHADMELSRLHRFLHFWVLVVKSFNRNRCPIRASALSFATLLALIPMLAVAMSITSSLLKKKQGEDQIYSFVDKVISNIVPPATITNNPIPPTPQTNAAAVSTATNSSLSESSGSTNVPATITSTSSPSSSIASNSTTAAITAQSNTNTLAGVAPSVRTTAQQEATKRIREFIQNTRSGALGVTGALLLIVVGIRMLGSIESTFNDIWGVTRGRNWLSRIQIYCTGIVAGPLLLVSAAALMRGPHLQSTHQLIARMPIIGQMIYPTLTLLFLWLLFTLFYQFVPNTKVRVSAAIIGGIVGGTVWHVNNVFGFLYVSRVVSNSKIYGSLGLVPVFMLGVYFSWLFVLFGAQVSYAFQNRKLYLQERIAENVNQRGREFVALRLITCIGQRFQRGLRPPTVEQMSSDLGIPSRLVQQVLQTLIAAHLVIEIAGGEPAYTPGRPLELINAHHVLQAMRARGQELLTRDEPVRQEVYGEFARIQEAEKQAASAITMLALVNRADARLELAPPLAERGKFEVSPALVPPEEPEPKPVTQSQILPVDTVEIQKTVEPQTSETPVTTQTPELKPAAAIAHDKPPILEPVSHKASVAEPIPDEERDFPL